MSKKSRRRNKKILAALALAGGAAMLAKGRGKGPVSTAGQAVGVDRITPKTDYITKKAVVEPAAVTEPDMTGVKGYGHPIIQGNIKRKKEFENRRTIPGYGSAVAPPGILNPYNRFQNITGRAQRKGGGIAKRGKGAAYKSGGRVKSMGIAKRGGGIAKK